MVGPALRVLQVKWIICKYRLVSLLPPHPLLTVLVLIRNTTPRLRIDQAMKIFWGPVTLVALLAVALAWWGL